MLLPNYLRLFAITTRVALLMSMSMSMILRAALSPRLYGTVPSRPCR
jgi:hypothetical protein